MKKNILKISFATVLLVASLGGSCQGPPVVPLSAFNPGSSIPNPDDCDSIRLTRIGETRSGFPGSTVIRLATGSSSPWWKEIKCEITRTHMSCGRLHANDGPSTAPEEIFLFPHELNGARLIFTKPKTAGSPADVYQVVGLEGLANNTVLFTWERDRCP
jgi:hypothetical protein